MRIAQPDHRLPGARRAELRRGLRHPVLRLRRAVRREHRAAGDAPGAVRLRRPASGLVMSPSGVSSLAAMVLVGVLMGRGADARWLVAAGLVVMAAAELLDGADEPPDQPLAGGRAADGADPRPGAAVRPDQRGRLQVRPRTPARGGGRAGSACSAPRAAASARRWPRRSRSGASSSTWPAWATPRPVQPACARTSWTRPGRTSCSRPATRPRPSRWPCRGWTTSASSRPPRWPTSTSSGSLRVVAAALVILVLLMKRSVAEKGEHIGAE